MTCNILISWRQLWYVFLPNLKSRPDVLHFFAYSVQQKGIAILLIKCLCLLHWFGDLDTKLARFNLILWLQIYNDAVALLRDMPDPPSKFWVARNTALYRIFGYLHRIWVLHILEGNPCCAPILTLGKDFNPLCCIYATICSGKRFDELVLLLYLNTIVPMVNNILE